MPITKAVCRTCKETFTVDPADPQIICASCRHDADPEAGVTRHPTFAPRQCIDCKELYTPTAAPQKRCPACMAIHKNSSVQGPMKPEAPVDLTPPSPVSMSTGFSESTLSQDMARMITVVHWMDTNHLETHIENVLELVKNLRG